MKVNYRISPLNIIMITIGTALYAFGFVNFNMENHLAEGGVSGITLILHSLWGLNPAYTSLLINIPILLMGWKFFGRKALVLTIYGTIALSIFIEIFQRVELHINVGQDLLIAALLSGVFAGTGLGLVFRYGGTTGGSDVIARIIEHKTGNQVGQSLLVLDLFVMLASLSYIDLRHMMYTVIMAFVVSQIIDLVQNGGYAVRGMLIITKHPEGVARTILEELGRGVTYLHGQGGYSQKDMRLLYVVLGPHEVNTVKAALGQIDPQAFVSIINVHEVIGEGFTWDVPKKVKLPWQK
ncbi:YitT family protein [Streptococcus ovuberis]|uniref:YitT family protein n=1 Tax=Streptococcus ovuberis TaxID=1936207 RepID=A0A7X6N0Z5_9STRE|nr:YitT family protein [Streptococcus ovuberis]NKZ20212.1 YitT family protein [Streptococcus ovuberis]